MSQLLNGGTAVVTAAAKGIGRETAIAFARDGCTNLALGDIDIDALKKTADFIAGEYPSVKLYTSYLDVRDENLVQKFFGVAVERFTRLDFAVNVAGAGHAAKPTHELSEKVFNDMYDINQRALFFCERALLRQMMKQQPLDKSESRGSIVNITTIFSTAPPINLAGYAASKGAALGLSRTDALDYASDHIRVNCVAPGYIGTEALYEVIGEEGVLKLPSRIPMGRIGRPKEVADTAVWLSSPQASFITGANIVMDGGMTLSTGPP